MWTSLAAQGLGPVASSIGYTAQIGLAAEVLVEVNKHIFVPGLEKADIAITRKIWGEEASLKTQ